MSHNRTLVATALLPSLRAVTSRTATFLGARYASATYSLTGSRKPVSPVENSIPDKWVSRVIYSEPPPQSPVARLLGWGAG